MRIPLVTLLFTLFASLSEVVRKSSAARAALDLIGAENAAASTFQLACRR